MLTCTVLLTDVRTVVFASCKNSRCEVAAAGRAHYKILVNGVLAVDLQSIPGESMEITVEQPKVEPTTPALSQSEIAKILAE